MRDRKRTPVLTVLSLLCVLVLSGTALWRTLLPPRLSLTETGDRAVLPPQGLTGLLHRTDGQTNALTFTLDAGGLHTRTLLTKPDSEPVPGSDRALRGAIALDDDGYMRDTYFLDCDFRTSKDNLPQFSVLLSHFPDYTAQSVLLGTTVNAGTTQVFEATADLPLRFAPGFSPADGKSLNSSSQSSYDDVGSFGCTYTTPSGADTRFSLTCQYARLGDRFYLLAGPDNAATAAHCDGSLVLYRFDRGDDPNRRSACVLTPLCEMPLDGQYLLGLTVLSDTHLLVLTQADHELRMTALRADGTRDGQYVLTLPGLNRLCSAAAGSDGAGGTVAVLSFWDMSYNLHYLTLRWQDGVLSSSALWMLPELSTHGWDHTIIDGRCLMRSTIAEGQDRTITCQWYGRTGTFTDYDGLAKAVVLDLSTEIPTVLYTAAIHFPYTSMQNPLCGDKFPREASAWLADWVYAEGGNP